MPYRGFKVEGTFRILRWWTPITNQPRSEESQRRQLPEIQLHQLRQSLHWNGHQQWTHWYLTYPILAKCWSVRAKLYFKLILYCLFCDNNSYDEIGQNNRRAIHFGRRTLRSLQFCPASFPLGKGHTSRKRTSHRWPSVRLNKSYQLCTANYEQGT